MNSIKRSVGRPRKQQTGQQVWVPAEYLADVEAVFLSRMASDLEALVKLRDELLEKTAEVETRIESLNQRMAAVGANYAR